MSNLVMNSEEKQPQPQPGQWWMHNNAILQTIQPGYHTVYFCGHNAKGERLFEDVDGHVVSDVHLDWSDWHHEPNCTGWDWRPEAMGEYPQWYSHKDGLFPNPGDNYLIQVDSLKNQAFVHQSGTIVPIQWPFLKEEFAERVERGVWRKLTKQQAEEALHPKLSADVVNDLAVTIRSEQHAEDPDEWVVQDRVPYRYGTDQRRWVSTADGRVVDDWSGELKVLTTPPQKHGYVSAGIMERLELRCRRRDLPKAEEPKAATKPVTVYEVIYSDDLKDINHRFITNEIALERCKKRWKYVSVLSSKTVEVRL